MNYKKDFPIFKNNKNLVYLDSAATSQKPKVVIDSITEFYSKYNSNVRRGLYPIAEKATAKVEEVRVKVAKFINAKSSEEIVFVRNATEALNLLAYSMSHNISPSDVITTSVMEHHSNFVPWQVLAAWADSEFQVLDFDDKFDLNTNFKSSTILAINHVSNVLGKVQNLENFKAGTVIVDAAQSVPHLKIDVQKLGCDFLAFSGHKIMAGTGIGVLYGKKEKLEKLEPFLFGGEMIREVSIKETEFLDAPFKFEAGTPDVAGIVSLGTAIDYLENIGMDNVQSHEQKLMAYALEQMKKIEGLEIYGPQNAKDRSSVISFNLEGIHAHDVAQVLADSNICIRSGHHCAMPLHKRLNIDASARVSFYIYNDEKDVEAFVEGLKKVKKIFKK